MKTLKISLIAIIICVQACYAQKAMTLKINFFDFIKPNNISLEEYRLNDTLTISYFRGGFDVYETNNNGTGIFFVIPQKEFGVWRKENKSKWQREKLWKNSQEKINSAEKFLSVSKDTLLSYFDLYVFYTEQSDIIFEGSYMTDDGQLRNDYYVKDDAIVYTYKYEEGVWIEARKESVNDGNLRSYGKLILKKILKERFGGI